MKALCKLSAHAWIFPSGRDAIDEFNATGGKMRERAGEIRDGMLIDAAGVVLEPLESLLPAGAVELVIPVMGIHVELKVFLHVNVIILMVALESPAFHIGQVGMVS
jgi:hypothetical protein